MKPDEYEAPSASGELVPLDPREAFDLWLKRQEVDKTESTIESYRYRVEPFVEWLEERDIENLNDLNGRHLLRYDSELRSERDVQRNTLKNELGTIRKFLEFCIRSNAVEPAVALQVDVPSLSKDERINREKLPSERARDILDYLDRFKYASRDHVFAGLLWETGARIGSIRALDIEDVYLDEDDLDRLRYQEDLDIEESVLERILGDVEPPFLYFRHRPETGTPLKKKDAAERPVNITEELGSIISAYLNVNRPDQTDEHGREPLLASAKSDSRLSLSGMRMRAYVLTQPCRMGKDCPHGRDPETCEAREHGGESKCPSVRSPHKWRTGSITWHRDRGWPPEEIAVKMATSVEMVNSVYDQPEKLKRMNNRRTFLDDLE